MDCALCPAQDSGTAISEVLPLRLQIQTLRALSVSLPDLPKLSPSDP